MILNLNLIVFAFKINFWIGILVTAIIVYENRRDKRAVKFNLSLAFLDDIFGKVFSNNLDDLF